MSLLKEVKELHAYMIRQSGAMPDIVWNGNCFTIYDANGAVHRQYKPTPTGERFHSDNSFVRYLIGPVGSAKSTISMTDIVKLSCQMPACIDGVRRMRAVLIRNSMPDLKTSTLKTWDHWFDGLGLLKAHRDSPLWYDYTFSFLDELSGNSGMVELEVYFLSGDEHPKKLEKFLSTEFTIAYLNEARALPQVLFERLIERVGRYPSKDICPHDYYNGIIMDTNPPKMRHWLYDMFELTKPDGFKMFKCPPGLIRDVNNPGKYLTNPEADNLANLSENYYMNMTLTDNEEAIKVSALGEYGQVREGEAIYAQYNDDIHSVDSIEFEPFETVYLGWDFGLTPTCLVCQFINGQLRAIQEFVSPFNTSVEELAESRVLPWIKETFRAPGLNYMDVDVKAVYDPSDPKGAAVKISPSMVLMQLGIRAFPAPTNEIQPRIDSVKYFLDKLVGGKPAYILSRRGCPVLREGFINEYRYRKINTLAGERLEEKPDKTHPHSDIHDAQQYIALLCHGEYHRSRTVLRSSDLMRNSTSVMSKP